jgi:hypothetical protein
MKVDRVGPERIQLWSEPPGEAKQQEKFGRRTGRRVWKQFDRRFGQPGIREGSGSALRTWQRELPGNPGRVPDGAKVSGSGFEGSVQERLCLGMAVQGHGFRRRGREPEQGSGPGRCLQRQLFGSESCRQHPVAQVVAFSEAVFLRKPYLARQGVGQTSNGGEEPAGRAERLRKGLFGGLEAVEPVGKSVFSVNRGSGFRIQAKLRCLTAVFDCGGFTAKGCFGSPAQ